MSEANPNLELVRLLLSASLPLLSVTVVILAHLLEQYARVKPLGEQERRPYLVSSIITAIALALGGIEVLTGLAYLLNVYPPSMDALLRNLIVLLFTLVVVSVVSGGIFLTMKVLRTKG